MASDGTIKISIEVDGKQVDAASKSLDNLEVSGTEAGKGAKNAEDGLKGVGDESNKASGNIKKFVAALGLVAIGAAVFNTLRKSLDDAISRFDTLNSFPKVMEQIGFSAEESEAAINKLSDGIEGLPTKLDDVASTAQQIAVMTGDLDGAVDTTLALNNAFLASGASTADAQRGLQQYVQMLSKGEVDLQSWRTLQETMGVALNDVAKAFGFAGESAQNDLYDALKSGEITFNEFNAKLIELSNETGGFADRAKTASAGIATSLGNLRNAAARGIAGIIDSFDKLSLAVTGKDIAHHIDSMKVVINAAFNAIKSTIEATAPVFKAFGVVIQGAISVLKPLTPAIIGAATAYAGFLIIQKISSIIKAHTAILLAAEASQKLLAVSTKATTVATAAQTGVIGASTLAIGVLTGRIGLATAAKLAFAAATKAVGLALKAFAGPIGWITIAIGALVGAVVGIVNWFNKTSEEAERLNGETEALAESTDALNQSVSESTESYSKHQNEIKSNAEANEDLANKIETLAEKENKSAAEKEMLNQYIEQLNGSVNDLNLAYNEEADALSMSSEELAARVALTEEQTSFNAALERQTEIIKEQNEVQMELDKINSLREEWNQKLEDGTVKSGEHKDAIAKLDEQEAELIETLKLLAEQYGITEEEIAEASENAAQAIEDGNLRQIKSYEDLDEAQQAVFDNMKTTYDDLEAAATDAFDKIDTKTDHTMKSMTETMEHNQAQVEKWGENQAKLLDWAGENSYENFIPYIENMGIDSAAELAVLAEAGDDELRRFADAVENGADVAAGGLKDSLGEGAEEAVENFLAIMDDGSQSLRDQIESSGFDEIGSMIPEGMKKGIEDNAGGVSDATVDMADEAIKNTKSILGIASPSRVFKQMGIHMPEGMALGIDQGAPKVLQAIERMFKAVERTSASNLRNISKGYDTGVSQIEKTLSKLTQVVQRQMNNASKSLRSGAQTQMNELRNLVKNYDLGSQQIDRSLNRLTQVIQRALQNMLNHLKSGARAQQKELSNLVKGYVQGGQQINKSLTRIIQIVHRSMQNMTNRFKSGANMQLNSLRLLANQLPRPFNSTPGQFNRIGQHAMSGLNSGLNAGAARVMSTARSIANRVASTMKAALKIKSPSRIMKDDVGKWIPAGIAVGIEDNAKLVYKALEDLSAGMIKPVSPEMALGVNHMGAFGSHSTQSISNTETKYNTVDMQGMFDGAVFNVRTDNDIKQIAKELNDYIKLSARRGGVVMP